jgi:hypothetical protein
MNIMKAVGLLLNRNLPRPMFLQVLRAFGIPQRKHLYFISVSGAF